MSVPGRVKRVDVVRLAALYGSRVVTMRAVAVLFTAALVWGCASAPAPPPPSSPVLERAGRLVVVASGPARFMVVEHSAEPGRTLDQIVKWTPYFWLRALVPLVHEGINQLIALDDKAVAGSDLEQINPRSVVGDTLTRRLEASGQFAEIRALPREPIGEDRRRADAFIRVSVSRWGLVRVREGDPTLVSAFTDVHAQMVMRETGMVVWELREDVTHPERLPLKTFISQRELARTMLLEVLERAGHRLGSELLYAKGAGS